MFLSFILLHFERHRELLSASSLLKWPQQAEQTRPKPGVQALEQVSGVGAGTVPTDSWGMHQQEAGTRSKRRH